MHVCVSVCVYFVYPAALRAQDERQRATNVHHRVERKWLGSYAVPFSTLHLNSRVSSRACFGEHCSFVPYHTSCPPPLPSPPQFEGTLTVDIPPFILGYSQGRQQDVLEFGLEEESFSHIPNTSLHVFVSVDPPLPQLPSVKHKVHVDTHAHTHTQSDINLLLFMQFDSTEPTDLLLQADAWLQKLLNKFPKRQFQVLYP